ncbi:MAG: 3-oxoacyl-ACP reductase, partial [Magnetococcales bacterium]|nr:3-oxoacyl-ACP reductase [Magnetococcales bacterium]
MARESSRKREGNFRPIAVVGVSTQFPGEGGTEGFWRDIVSGTDAISDVPASHWLIEDYYDSDPKAEDKTYCKRGGFLSPVSFDAIGLGLPPNTLPATDTSQLLTLMIARRLLQKEGADRFPHIDRERIGIMLGVTSATELVASLSSRLQRPVWLNAMRASGLPEQQAQEICQRIADSYVPWQEASFPGLLGNVVAGRVANRLDLGGPNFVSDAACASSLSAMQTAIHSLQLGETDMVVTGGADAMNDIFMYMCFSKTPAFSPSGECRPFSDKADGTLIGEGVGLFALRRLEDAEKDGDPILAVIRGLGGASDGRASSVYAPRPSGQARAIAKAYEVAGYGPETIGLLEAHGTATKAGDVAEFKGLRTVFDPVRRESGPSIALGSVKSQIGHTKAAAGAAGVFKAVMALHHKVLPPTLKVDRPNPALEMESSAFYLNTETRPWIHGAEHPRRASVSSFGFGGSNFHITLEEYTGPGRHADRIRTLPAELITLSAPDRDTLIARCRALLESQAEAESCVIARTSQEGFDSEQPERLILLLKSGQRWQSRMQRAIDLLE